MWAKKLEGGRRRTFKENRIMLSGKNPVRFGEQLRNRGRQLRIRGRGCKGLRNGLALTDRDVTLIAALARGESRA